MKIRGCADPSKRACSEPSAAVRHVLGTCHRRAGTARYRHAGHGAVNAPPSGQQNPRDRERTGQRAALGSLHDPRSRPRQGQTLWSARHSSVVGDRTVDRGRDPAQSSDRTRGGPGSANNRRP